MELLRREKKNLVVQSVVLECHKWTLCLVVKAMGHDEISTWQRACSVLFGRGGGGSLFVICVDREFDRCAMRGHDHSTP